MGSIIDRNGDAAVDSSRLDLQRSQRGLDEFRLAIDAIPGMVWIALPDGNVDFLNRRWREYTGLSLADASGWGWSAAIHPDDRTRVEDFWRSVFASGREGEIEARWRRNDGVYRWFLARGVPLRDAAGTLVKWYGQTTDIDDLKRTEAQLRHSEAFLTEAQRLSLTGCFGWNVATGELVWSSTTFCILGYEPSTKPAMHLFLRRVHPDDRDFVQQTFDRAQRDQADLDFENRLALPDGSIKHVRVMAHAAQTSAGTIEFVGALMDVTERSRAAEALRLSEHLARGQLEALTRTLTALSRESKPEKFLEHILRMICAQLGAHSIGVWEMNEATGYLDLVASYDDRLHLPTPEQMQVNPQTEVAQGDHPVWSGFFRGEIDCAYGRIDSKPPWVHVAKDLSGPWYDNFGRPTGNPLVSKMSEQLSTLGIVATLCIPTLVAGKVCGFFSIRFKEEHRFRQEEIALTQAMAHQATLAIQLMRLSQQSREAAVIAERVRMARDIHDTLAQGFTGVIVQLEAAKGAIAHHDLADAGRRMERASELARSSLREARRSVLALRPRSLQGASLDKALNDLLKRTTDGISLQAELKVEGEERVIAMDWEENLLRITQEALTNTIKHAHALTFQAILVYARKDIQLQLIDDGQGFDVEGEHEGFGLIGMKERVESMAGRFLICSKPGKGTEIRVILINPPAE